MLTQAVNFVDLGHFSVEDVEEVHQLERSATDFPWAKKSIVSSIDAGHDCFCYRDDGEIVAFAILSLVLDEATLLNVAVAPSHRRRGVARQLIEHALERLQARGAGMCMLEVRQGNRGAQALYYELGFYEMGHRANYYPAKMGREDAVLMCMPL